MKINHTRQRYTDAMILVTKDEVRTVISHEEESVLELFNTIDAKINSNWGTFSTLVQFLPHRTLPIFADSEPAFIDMLIYLAQNIDENWSKSPYSFSFYSSKDIDWDYKPDKSLRISDHWNFTDKHGKKHCVTNCHSFNSYGVGVYDESKKEYTIIKEF